MRLDYLTVLSFVLIIISGVMFFMPGVGILIAMVAIVIQVFRGVFLSKPAIIAGIAMILILSAIVIFVPKGNMFITESKALVSTSTPVLEEESSPPPEPNPLFSFDWEMIAVILGLLTSVAGWYESKKHRKETLKLISQIDSIYNAGKINPQEGLNKLAEIKENLKKEFDQNKIDEGTFQLLYKMVERDMDDISSKQSISIPQTSKEI